MNVRGTGSAPPRWVERRGVVCVCVFVCVFVWMCVWSCFDEDVIRAVICQSVTGEAVCCFFGGRFEARTHDQAPCVRVNVNTER